MRGRKRHRKKAAKKASRSRIRTMTLGFKFCARLPRLRRLRSPGESFERALRDFAAPASKPNHALRTKQQNLKMTMESPRRAELAARLATQTPWTRKQAWDLLVELEKNELPSDERFALQIIRARESGIPLSVDTLRDLAEATDREPRQ